MITRKKLPSLADNREFEFCFWNRNNNGFPENNDGMTLKKHNFYDFIPSVPCRDVDFHTVTNLLQGCKRRYIRYH